MNKKIIVVIAVVVILAAGAGLYFFVLSDESEPPEVRIEIVPVGEVFTTNVKGSQRILRAGVVLVVDREGLEDLLAARNNAIRDTIIFTLRDLEEEEIREVSQDNLRRRLATALNNTLGIDNVVTILFNDFVMA